MTADQTVRPADAQTPGQHWALECLLDRDRRRHAAAEAIPLGRLRAQLAQSSSAGDLADRLAVTAQVLDDRLDTLDEEETWQLAAHLAFPPTSPGG